VTTRKAYADKYKVCVDAVDAAIKRGEIKAIKIGRGVRDLDGANAIAVQPSQIAEGVRHFGEGRSVRGA